MWGGIWLTVFAHRYNCCSRLWLAMLMDSSWQKYNPKYETHIFFPQILYTIKINQKFYIGGSFVTIRRLEEFISIGTAKDIAAIIPIYRSKDNSNNVNSINFAIGMFRPILWKPDKSSWHPTYSIDLNLKLHSR